MKIDLHVHIHRTSRCAKEDIEPMAIAAREKGLDGIVVLDHNYQATFEECKSIKVEGLSIFSGMEVNVFDEDVVIISSCVMDFLPKYKEKLKDLERLSKWVKDTNSLAILAHPFRRHPHISFDLTKFRPQAIEFSGRHVDKVNRKKIFDLAKSEGMSIVAVSDAHKSSQLGGFCIDLDRRVSDEAQLIREIKCGEYSLMEYKLSYINDFGSRGDSPRWPYV